MRNICVQLMLEALAIPGSVKAVLECTNELIREQHDLTRVELPVLTFNRGETENGLSTAIRNMGVPRP
jgi:hypothetical protein